MTGSHKSKSRTLHFSVRDDQFKKALASNWYRGTNCVMVARTPRGVAVRDSKDSSKVTLHFTRTEWKAFLQGVQSGEFDV